MALDTLSPQEVPIISWSLCVLEFIVITRGGLVARLCLLL